MPKKGAAALALLTVCAIGSAQADTTYIYRLPAKGLKLAAAVAPPASPVGDGGSKSGACANGAATGCASSFTAHPGETGGIVTFLGPTSKGAGKWYWEVSVTAVGVIPGMIGVAAINPGNGNYIGNTPQGLDYFGYNGTFHRAGNMADPAAAMFTTGDTIGVALDQGSRSVSFYKNCIFQKTVTLPGTATALFPGYSGYSRNAAGGTQTDSMDFNFGVSNFNCAVPAGYNAGWF
jgi:hypothetical protein